jgi:putative flippase GtrA
MLKGIKYLLDKVLQLFYPIFKKWMPFQTYAYLAVGAANTLLNIGLFILVFGLLTAFKQVEILHINLTFFAVEIATLISFLVSVITGFWLSKNFAFTKASNEKKEQQKQFGKYFLVSLQGQFSDYLITKGLIIFLFIHANIAYLISTVIMLVLNFFLQKYFTFKSK